MNCLTIILVALMNLMFVFSKPSKPSYSTDALDESINYDDICDFHYNNKMTMSELIVLLSKGINYTFDIDVIHNNIKDENEKKELKKLYSQRFSDNLENADKKFTNNNLETRVDCGWKVALGCTLFGIGIDDERLCELCFLTGHDPYNY